VLPRYEHERSETRTCDLAAAIQHRRKGIATALPEKIRRIASARGSSIVLVQADDGDMPAISLYSELGKLEDVLHFEREPIGSQGHRAACAHARRLR
jgi:aminoglycoside 3-N-acetyltransferase I